MTDVLESETEQKAGALVPAKGLVLEGFFTLKIKILKLFALQLRLCSCRVSFCHEIVNKLRECLHAKQCIYDSMSEASYS